MTYENEQKGRKNRKEGAEHELECRDYLINEGYTVSKWKNDVKEGELVPAKNLFWGKGRAVSLNSGFPDFVAFKLLDNGHYEVLGVEAKSNGYLTPEERIKMQYYLDNHIFSKLYVYSQGIMTEWKSN